MYEPTHFVEDNLETLHALIRAHPLGLLISSDANDLQANAVPFILKPDMAEGNFPAISPGPIRNGSI